MDTTAYGVFRRELQWLEKCYFRKKLSSWQDILATMLLLEIERFQIDYPAATADECGKLLSRCNSQLSCEERAKIDTRARNRFLFFIEAYLMLEAFQAIVGNRTVRIMELCSGDAGMGILFAALGYQCCSVDFSEERQRRTKMISQAVLQDNASKHQVVVGDVLARPFSKKAEAEVWIGCQPCADNVSLPDRIMEKWAEDSSAEALILKPCCPEKWRADYPQHLARWIGSSVEWVRCCDEARSFSGRVACGKSGYAMDDRINFARERYLEERGARFTFNYVGLREEAYVMVARR